MIDFTDEQQSVAMNRDERLIVRALAGTGKTETVALRVKLLVAEGTSPSSILTVCFTRSAKIQLQNRLASYGLHGVNVRTLSSVALEMVQDRRRTESLPKFRTGDGDKLMRATLEQNQLSSSKHQVETFKAMYAALARQVLPKSLPSGVESLTDAVHLFRAYNDLKQEQGYFDFIDTEKYAVSLATPRFEEVLVDEAQDLTPALAEMTKRLTKSRLVWVGDENQSIFAFAGVDPELFKQHADWSQVTLSESFRQAHELLDVPNALLQTGELRSNIPGGAVQTLHCSKKELGAAVIARRRLLRGSVAVLGATRHILTPLANEVLRSGYTASRSWSTSIADADIHFSTVHSAKGGEWDTVILLDSYVEQPSAEHLRLFYVGTTRPKTNLLLHTTDGRLLPGVKTHG